MTTNAEWMLKNGYKFNELDCNSASDIYEYDITLNGKCIERVTSYTCFNALKEWLDAEHNEPILDDAEKQYLSAVIKPFRDDVQYIVKFGGKFSSRAYEEIDVRYQDKMSGDKYCFLLPRFEKGTMYKGMEVNRHYTLEELGL